MKIKIRIAETVADRERSFRFRYEIYVEEMGRKQTYADPVRRRIEEPFDERGHLLIAEAGDRVVGTLRTNFARETDLGYYLELFGLDSVGADFPGAVSLTTKLMVHPAYRSGTLAVRMAQALYEYGIVRGIRWDFLDCNAHLEDFFTRLGYEVYRPHVEHPEYGPVLPMRLNLLNLRHLLRIHSPLALCEVWKQAQPRLLAAA